MKRVLACLVLATLVAALAAPAAAMAVGWETPAASVTRAGARYASAIYHVSESDGGWSETQVAVDCDVYWRAVGSRPHASTSLLPDGYVVISRYYPATATLPERLIEGSAWSFDAVSATIADHLDSASGSFCTEPLSWTEYQDVMPWEDQETGGHAVRCWYGDAVAVDASWVGVDGARTGSKDAVRFREPDYRYNYLNWGGSRPAEATLTVTGADGTVYADAAPADGDIGTWGYKEVSIFHLRPGDYLP